MKKIIAISATLSLMIFCFGQVWAAPQNPPSAPVTVVNTSTNPVPVNITNLESPATPFQAQLCRAVADISTCGSLPDILTVPAGKRLVVEFVNGFCEVLGSTTTLQYVQLRTAIGSEYANHYFTLTPVSPPVATGNRYTFTQQTRIYADPETGVGLGLKGDGPDGRRCYVTISGQLVTAP